jgi:hypothetical protein
VNINICFGMIKKQYFCFFILFTWRDSPALFENSDQNRNYY